MTTDPKPAIVNHPVHAVLVTYQPDAAITNRLEATRKQVKKLIIIDNASDAETVERLQTYASRHDDSVRLILNKTNLGLAAAQNQGIRYALERGAEWILLLDDDSTPADNMVENLLGFLCHPTGLYKEKIALLAPHILQPDSPHPTRYVVPRGKLGFRRVSFYAQPDTPPNTIYPTAVIASGSLIRADVLREIGLMQEDLFIDYIDTEFCLRLRKHGHRIAVIREAELTHHIGAKQAHTLGVVTSNHSPGRRYTIFRNRVIVWKRYVRTSPHYIVYDVLAAVYDLFRILVFEQQKRAKLAAALRGFWHGLRDKMDFAP